MFGSGKIRAEPDNDGSDIQRGKIPTILCCKAVLYRQCGTFVADVWFWFPRRSKLTQIVVDVSAGPFKDRTVMFLGSDDGRVLKVLASTHPNDSFGTKLLEDIDVYNPSKYEYYSTTVTTTTSYPRTTACSAICWNRWMSTSPKCWETPPPLCGVHEAVACVCVCRCNVQGQEDRRVLGLELDKDHHALFVAFSSCVIRVPLSRCSQHAACKT